MLTNQNGKRIMKRYAGHNLSYCYKQKGRKEKRKRGGMAENTLTTSVTTLAKDWKETQVGPGFSLKSTVYTHINPPQVDCCVWSQQIIPKTLNPQGAHQRQQQQQLTPM
jgi:hypothetical protein